MNLLKTFGNNATNNERDINENLRKNIDNLNIQIFYWVYLTEIMGIKFLSQF